MEFKLCIEDTHSRPVLAVAINPNRREIYTGSEDATIKVFDTETGKLLNTLSGHRGPITCLNYIKDIKLLLSGAIDGSIIVWGSNFKLLQRVETKSPIYSMAYFPRRQQIIVGFNGKVRVYQVQVNDDLYSDDIIETRSYLCSEHEDIVRCVLASEGRFYSAGYDRKLIIYNAPSHSEMWLKVLFQIPKAHDAAICSMVYAKDAENSWIITGSFDRTVKLWSLEGVLLQKYDAFLDTIWSLCYLPPIQLLWISTNQGPPLLYDPRSGVNVSEFVTFGRAADNEKQISAKNMFFCAETNELWAINGRKCLLCWRFNINTSVTVLSGHTSTVECLCSTANEPLIIYSGGADGVIRRWERTQLNAFMYSQEQLFLQKETILNSTKVLDRPIFRSTIHSNSEMRRKLQVNLRKHIQYKLNVWQSHVDDSDVGRFGQSRQRETKHQLGLMSKTARESFNVQDRQLRTRAKKLGVFIEDSSAGKKENHVKSTIICSVYYDKLDLLITGNDDHRIYVWGYSLQNDNIYLSNSIGNSISGHKGDAINNQIAGLVQKYVFQEHKDVVSAIICINYHDKHYLLSTGWDRRIIIWNLQDGSLQDVLRTTITAAGCILTKEELAADGMIYSMDYSELREEFGYASADKYAYIRKFSEDGSKMRLKVVLQGHEAEVTCIRWNKVTSQWITGSEDQTVRIWSCEGLVCSKIINNEGPVFAMCIDLDNGCIVTGSSDHLIRVIDSSKDDAVVSRMMGHSDIIRSIIHIPSRCQYVSASWDQTIRIWNAYVKKGHRINQTQSEKSAYSHSDNLNDRQIQRTVKIFGESVQSSENSIID